MSRRRKRLTAAVIVVVIVVIAAVAIALTVLGKETRRRVLFATHPIQYAEYVEEYSAEYGLDKYLLYAFIKTESGFDPDAVSDTGARGLMQLMETTFDWVKFRLGDGDEVVYDDMFDPEMNIRYGAYLVSYLLGRFGSTDTAAAAYFSGVGEVSGWLENSEYSEDGVHLDKIPSRNCAHYVSKIQNALSVYTELYAEERTD